LVSYNGRVWIYTYRTDNFLEKIKTLFARTLVYVLSRFVNTDQNKNEALLINSEERVNGPSRRIVALENEKKHLTTTLDGKINELEITVSANKKLENQLIAKNKELEKALAETLAAKNKELEDKEKAFVETVAARTQEITALQSQLTTKNKELEEAVQLSTDKEKAFAETVAARALEITTLQAQLEIEKRTLTEAIQKAVKDGQSECQVLQEQIKSKEATISSLAEQLEQEKQTHEQHLTDVSKAVKDLQEASKTFQQKLDLSEKRKAEEKEKLLELFSSFKQTLANELENYKNASQGANSGEVRKAAIAAINDSVQKIIDFLQ